MSHDITASLEAEYEPEHDETDDRTVVNDSDCYHSDDPVCM